ncbi:hypothetical protein CORC01_05623 [Colletotrichum orchidophilum]|uniref:Uncharacterized protein n=1 Tax=Colletotrichum orchidophilum TaxID=1209926 RepID=A0A1G4BCP0_9PEZI|nr:uncharacterized protein CORC01_05623 [Colletotrichum orchidophilum]OHE99130.1 hypothetical protein CORC01_05623 [Colletotrichum orchidophilum]
MTAHCQTFTAHGGPTANINNQSQLMIAIPPRAAEPVPNCSQSRARETSSCLVNSVARKDSHRTFSPACYVMMDQQSNHGASHRSSPLAYACGCHRQPASACPHGSHATCQSGGGLSECSEMPMPKARPSYKRRVYLLTSPIAVAATLPVLERQEMKDTYVFKFWTVFPCMTVQPSSHSLKTSLDLVRGLVRGQGRRWNPSRLSVMLASIFSPEPRRCGPLVLPHHSAELKPPS